MIGHKPAKLIQYHFTIFSAKIEVNSKEISNNKRAHTLKDRSCGDSTAPTSWN
jgi:hypothetical protein